MPPLQRAALMAARVPAPPKRGQASQLCVAPNSRSVLISTCADSSVNSVQCATRGVVMLGRLRRSRGRQFSAAVLIFVLALQSIIAAIATGGPAVADIGSPDFEICHHSAPLDDGGNAATPGNVPDRSGVHCVFCLAGAAHALAAPVLSAEFHIVIFTAVPWTFTTWRLPTLTVDASARPRGPPPAA
jgi:hypothetical protein